MTMPSTAIARATSTPRSRRWGRGEAVDRVSGKSVARRPLTVPSLTDPRSIPVNVARRALKPTLILRDRGALLPLEEDLGLGTASPRHPQTDRPLRRLRCDMDVNCPGTGCHHRSSTYLGAHLLLAIRGRAHRPSRLSIARGLGHHRSGPSRQTPR